MRNNVIVALVSILLLCLILSAWKPTEEGFEEQQREDAPKKIAFCFLIYDSINHEELWKKFFKNVDQKKYTIYIHYKENKPMKYFEKYKLPKCLDTRWGELSLVKASNMLFKTAYEDDPQNYKFILLSNSCIPLASFDKIYKIMTRDNYGYIHDSGEDVNNQDTKIYRSAPKRFGKCSQWVILNRKMVKNTAFIEESKLNLWYSDVFAPDEIYYYTSLKHKNMMDQIRITESSRPTEATTFALWSDDGYPFPNRGPGKPKMYEDISLDELMYLYNQPCLFGRKFKTKCKVLIQGKTIRLEDVLEYV